MEIKETSLINLHKSYGAKLVEFAGYNMPIQYSEGILNEHKFTRSKLSLIHRQKVIELKKSPSEEILKCYSTSGYVYVQIIKKKIRSIYLLSKSQSANWPFNILFKWNNYDRSKEKQKN